MNKIIIPTGYMGSGSSAITDLIREFDGYDNKNGTFEYVFLHCPDGVFDLEDKLLVGNNAVRSDEAIHSFLCRMKKLYESKLWWVGNYKNVLHKDFLKVTNEYVEELTEYKSDNYWYMQQKPTVSRVIKLGIRKILKIISCGKIVLPVPLNYAPMRISLVSKNEFYNISKKYICKILQLLGRDENNLVLDQLLLPFNLWRMHNYFDEDVECFVVERDPRDIFIINKYIWYKRDEEVPYPTDSKTYCEYYKKLRSIEKKAESEHVHRIHFEDLIYQYEQTVKQVYEVLGITEDAHVHKREYFNPDISINNTQLFLDEKYADEIQYIEENLKEYLYDFPYRRVSDTSKTF